MNWNSLLENLLAEVFGLVAGIFVTYCVVEVLLNRRASRQWDRIRFVAYAEMSRITLRLYEKLLPWQNTDIGGHEIWNFNGSEIFAPCDISCISWKVSAKIEENLSSNQLLDQFNSKDYNSNNLTRLKELNAQVSQAQLDLDRYTLPLIEKLPIDLGELLFALSLELNNHIKLMNIEASRPDRDNWLIANTITRSMKACCNLLSYLRTQAKVISHESWSSEMTEMICDDKNRSRDYVR